jgi:hypothetical protein
MCRVSRFDRKVQQRGFEKSRENESARRLNRVRFAASKASRLRIYTHVIFLSDIFLSSRFFSVLCVFRACHCFFIAIYCLIANGFVCVSCLAISSACRSEHTPICLHVSSRYEHYKVLPPAERGWGSVRGPFVSVDPLSISLSILSCNSTGALRLRRGQHVKFAAAVRPRTGLEIKPASDMSGRSASQCATCFKASKETLIRNVLERWVSHAKPWPGLQMERAKILAPEAEAFVVRCRLGS